MFVDEIVIEVYGGRGGHGMVSFRREKYVEYGGPSGGNGGNGGSIIFIGDEGKSTLIDFRYRRHIKADAGENGKSKGMFGANASDTYVKVPLGTIVFDFEKNIKIGEVLMQGQTLVVAKGGKGGRGNMAFATKRNPAPHFAENGDQGVYLKIKLELKVLADVGVIGYPSVGKSTLISVISNAKPKIADYPFTTLSPNLGVVLHKNESFVIADLPGLIENAHQGVGLGIRFLKHIERCRVFIHMLDLSREDPYLDFQKINYELEKYDPKLLNRKMIVVLSKTDLLTDEKKLLILKEQLQAYDTIEISAVSNHHIDALLDLIIHAMKEVVVEEVQHTVEKIYTPEIEQDAFHIELIEDVFYVTGDKLRVMFDRIDFTKDEAVKRFARQLRTLGVDDALRSMGAKHGDIVRLFDYEFEFIDG